jgi:hypothetical protein
LKIRIRPADLRAIARRAAAPFFAKKFAPQNIQ